MIVANRKCRCVLLNICNPCYFMACSDPEKVVFIYWKWLFFSIRKRECLCVDPVNNLVVDKSNGWGNYLKNCESKAIRRREWLCVKCRKQQIRKSVPVISSIESASDYALKPTICRSARVFMRWSLESTWKKPADESDVSLRNPCWRENSENLLLIWSFFCSRLCRFGRGNSLRKGDFSPFVAVPRIITRGFKI